MELLEFSWPLLQDLDIDQEPETCLAYAVMRRPNGFLLCVPSGFFREGDLLAAQTAEDDALLGPSVELLVPPVVLTDAGEWARADDQAAVPCVVVDLALRVSDAISQADLTDSGARPFLPDKPDTFPLASEVVRKSRAWVAENLGGLRSGYQTATGSGCEGPHASKEADGCPSGGPAGVFRKGPRRNLGTVGTDHLHELGCRPGPRAPAPATKGRHFCTSVGPHCRQGSAPRLSSKGSGFLVGSASSCKGCLCPSCPCCGRRPTNLGRPGARRHGRRPWSGRGGHATAEPGFSSARVSDRSELRPPRRVWISGLFALDSWHQLPPAHASRARTQEGHFAARMRSAAVRRIAPATAEAALLQEGLMTRYLERFGGYQGQQLVGLLQWQLAQISDLLAADCPLTAADLVSQAMIMLEQVAVDRGRHELTWLFTLQQDPPASLFANHQTMPTAALRPFAPLADSKLVACTMAFMKELDTLSTKRLELTGSKTKPSAPVPPTVADDGGPPEPPLTKKQQRARAWAAAKKASQP